METIKNLREEINQIDKKIIELLLNREKTVKKIGEIKKAKGEKILVVGREKEILEKMPNLRIKSIFKEILNQSKIIQDNL